MTPDERAIEALALCILEVDRADGAIYRVATRGRTGRVIPCARARVDYIENTGYRRVRVGKAGTLSAHRIVWIALFGAIPADVEVNHKNLDKSDNRPDNLELTTHLDNIQHAMKLGVVPPMRGERNGQSKLTETDVANIRAAFAKGEAKRSIARRFGVTPTHIRHIVSGRAWKHTVFRGVA